MHNLFKSKALQDRDFSCLKSAQIVPKTSALGDTNVEHACYSGNEAKVLRKTAERAWVVDKYIASFSASWMKHIYDFGFLSSFGPIILIFTSAFVISPQIKRSLFPCVLWHYMVWWLKRSWRDKIEWRISSHC